MAKTDLTDTMYAGNARTLEFLVVDEDAVGEPALDLTGFSAKWAATQIDPGTGNFLVTPLIIEKKSSVGPAEIELVAPLTDGKIHVKLVGADTSNANTGDFYFELELTDASSNTIVVATGTLTILRNVENT